MNRRNSGWLLAALVGMAWVTSSIYSGIGHRHYYLLWQPPSTSDWSLMREDPKSYDACLAERARSIIESYERKLRWESKSLETDVRSLSRDLSYGGPLPSPVVELHLNTLERRWRSLEDLEIEHRVNLSECVEAGDRRVVAAEAALRKAKAAIQADNGSAVVSYTPGQPIVTSVTLNNRLSARLILDTGADRSMVNRRSLIGAGVDLTRPIARGTIRGVAGEIEVSYFTVDSIEVGAASVRNLQVGAHDIGLTGSDGLLGRDSLDRFNVSIDSAAGIIKLTPR